MKVFVKYSGKNIKFGSEAGILWKEVLDSAATEDLINQPADKVKLDKKEVEKKSAVFMKLKALVDKAIDSGYNFEF